MHTKPGLYSPKLDNICKVYTEPGLSKVWGSGHVLGQLDHEIFFHKTFPYEMFMIDFYTRLIISCLVFVPGWEKLSSLALARVMRA